MVRRRQAGSSRPRVPSDGYSSSGAAGGSSGWNDSEAEAEAARASGMHGAGSDAEGATLGVTLDGQRVFAMPETYSHVHSLLVGWRSWPSLLAYAGIIVTAAVAVCTGEPRAALVAAAFWRLAYNGGIGCLLKLQSDSHLLTEWVAQARREPFSRRNALLGTALRSSMPGARDVLNDNTLPASYPAWIALRCAVNVCETNDVFAFTLTAVLFGAQARAREPSDYLVSMLWPLADAIGLLLIALSLYSKWEARRTAGDYAWYWGDFFFLRTGSAGLSYDGVFELFPHPMYTVGYGWTYGCALLARSSSVLACAAVFHLSQLVFLTLVESPHVHKLYGGENGLPLRAPVQPRPLPGSSMQALTRAAQRTRSGANKLVQNFDLYRASDVNLALTLFFFVTTLRMGSFPGGPLDDDAFFVLQALFWHLLSFAVKVGVLVGQERTKFWTRHFADKGLSARAAFESWKKLYSMLQSLQHLGFLLCAARLVVVPARWDDCQRPEYISRVALGSMLVLISIWSFASCYEVLGDYGWFYGDFFTASPQAEAAKAEARKLRTARRRQARAKRNGGQAAGAAGAAAEEDTGGPTGGSDSGVEGDLSARGLPSYDGIYRYINNPDAYLGHLWMYGCSLLGGSVELFVVALLAHALKIAFLQAVEKPHFRQIYKQHVRTSSTALGRAIRGKVLDIRSNETAMFLANWVKHPIETGALAPSSEQLAQAMCDTMETGPGSVVVELGPGTGPFTREILRRQAEHANTTYLAFELNEEFIGRLRVLFPEHADSFLNASAERIVDELTKRGITAADTVVSGLPWAIFPARLQEAILTEVFKALKPGGRFCTFAYLQGLVLPAGQNFKALLDKVFEGRVERSSIVWKNLPPAFVYRCQKP